MTKDEIMRLYYYNRQYLGFQDFHDEQRYNIDMRRRHNLAHHTWGIVVGLELAEKPKEGADPEVDVYLQPGMAVDGFGREIIVCQPHKLDTTDFIAFTNTGYYEVWIAYVEAYANRPAPGYELCDVENRHQRVRETFRIAVQTGEVAHDPVIVDGKKVEPHPPPNLGDETIPHDKSVPYQEFPVDTDTRRWLVRLGSVNWDAGSRKFVKDIEKRLLEGRQYIGNVTAKVLAPSEELRIAARGTKSPLEPGDKGVKLTVEGSLQVERLITAKQDLNVSGNVGIGLPDPATPLAIKKAGASAPVGITQNQVGGGKSMELTTSDSNNHQATRILLRGGGNNRDIEFYRGGRGAETHSMTIKGDTGNVGIGIPNPDAKLHVNGNIKRQNHTVFDSGNTRVASMIFEPAGPDYWKGDTHQDVAGFSLTVNVHVSGTIIAQMSALVRMLTAGKAIYLGPKIDGAISSGNRGGVRAKNADDPLWVGTSAFNTRHVASGDHIVQVHAWIDGGAAKVAWGSLVVQFFPD